MCFKFATLALVCLGGLAARGIEIKEKRQLGQLAEFVGFFEQPKSSDLLIPAAAGFVQQQAPVTQAAPTQYFQYDHQPATGHYEHGHKRGREHHFIERHEKGHPHAGEFKTKVRWGDQHGGYGEHYYDFNHAGHGDDDGEESQSNDAYEDYNHEPSESKPLSFTDLDGKPLPFSALDGKPLSFAAADTSSSSTNQVVVPTAASGVSALPSFPAGVSALFATTSGNQQRGKRNPNPDDDVEFVDENARSRILDGDSPKHGGNYRKAKEEYRTKRHPVGVESTLTNPPNLFFDASSGYIVDQKTGRQFKLSPVQ